MKLDKYGNELVWIPKIDLTLNKPIYQIVVEAIQRDINEGILMRGFKMPPQRVLANQLGINHGTITRAYQICEEKGLIKGIVGKGTFIAASPGLPASLLVDKRDNNIISMGMAMPIYECNPYLEKLVNQIRDAIDYELTMTYCPPEGHIKHRYVAANWLKRFKINTEADNILITAGTQNALSIILMTLFKKGDRIIVDEYTYTGLISLASYMSIILVPVSGDEDGMDLDELEGVCKREQAKGIYVMSDYQNPTTVTMSDKKRKQLAKIVEKNNLLLIEDATYSFCLETKNKPISAYVPQNSLYIMGTSKSISPAFRISYIVAPDELVSRLSNGLNNIIWMSSPYTSEMVSLFQSTGAYDLIEREKILILKERNKLFENIMSDYSCVSAPTSCFRFVHLPMGYDDVELEYIALEKGVQILSANRFYVGSQKTAPCMRLAISTPNSLDDLEKALNITKEIFSTYSNTKKRPLF